MAQLVEESQSIYRIEEHYLKDAGDCDECQKYWKMLKKDKEEHIKKLSDLVQKHMK